MRRLSVGAGLVLMLAVVGACGDGPSGPGQDGSTADAGEDRGDAALDGGGGSDGGNDGMSPGASCSDGVKNGDETDVDCGGMCGGGAVGKICKTNVDCMNAACGPALVCVECVSAANCPGQDNDCGQR